MTGFLLGRYRAVSQRLEAEDLVAVRQALRVRLLGDAGAVVGLCATWAVLSWLVVQGVLPVAAAGAAIVGVRACSAALDAWVRAGAQPFRAALYLEDWSAFLRRAAWLRALRGPAVVAPGGPEVISASKVSFTYPGAAAPALCGVSVELRRGEVVALVGENGSGKTTLSKMLAGLYLPSTGVVSWDGVDLAGADPHRVWESMGMVPQQYTRWPMSLRDNITLGQGNRASVEGDDAVVAAAEAAGAAELAAACLTAGRLCWRALGGAGMTCPAGNGSGLRSRALSSATRRSWSWTSRPQPWTPAPSTTSFSDCVAWLPGAPRCSSPTGWPMCGSLTGSSCSSGAGSWRKETLTPWSRLADCSPSCTSCSRMTLHRWTKWEGAPRDPRRTRRAGSNACRPCYGGGQDTEDIQQPEAAQTARTS